jgi:prevent-host-death family protein
MGFPRFRWRAQYTFCTLRYVLITLTEARRKLGRIITQSRITGEEVTITDRDEPVATIVPVPPQGQQPQAEAG